MWNHNYSRASLGNYFSNKVIAGKVNIVHVPLGNKFLQKGNVKTQQENNLQRHSVQPATKLLRPFLRPLNPARSCKAVVSEGFIAADPSISFNNSRHRDYLVNRLSRTCPSTIDLSPVYLEWPLVNSVFPESQYEHRRTDRRACICIDATR